VNNVVAFRPLVLCGDGASLDRFREPCSFGFLGLGVLRATGASDGWSLDTDPLRGFVFALEFDTLLGLTSGPGGTCGTKTTT